LDNTPGMYPFNCAIGSYIFPGLDHSVDAWSGGPGSWRETVSPKYTGRTTAACCPSDTYIAKKWLLSYGYHGFYGAPCFNVTDMDLCWRKLSRIRNISSCLFMTETCHKDHYDAGGGNSNQDIRIHAPNPEWIIDGRHTRRLNVLYLDGRVQYRKGTRYTFPNNVVEPDLWLTYSIP